MTTIGQVAHLVRKDVTQFRWWLVGYTILTIAVTLAATQSLTLDSGPRAVAAPALWVVGVLIAALIVQSDTPGNSLAFWASRPIQPLALLSAKLCVVFGVLVVVPLVGLTIVLRGYSLSASELVSLLLPPFLFASGVLVAAMLVASLTSRTSSFLGVMFGVPLAIVSLASWRDGLPAWSRSMDAATTTALDLAALGGIAILLIVVYRSRATGRRWLAATTALLAASAWAILVTKTEPLAQTVGESTGQSVNAIVEEGSLAWLDPGAALTIGVTTSGTNQEHGYVFRPDSIRVDGLNGHTMTFPLYGLSAVPSSVRSTGAPQSTVSTSRSTHFFRFTLVQQDSLGGNIRHVRVLGSVEERAPALLASMRPTADTVLHDGRTRIHVSRVVEYPSRLRLEIDAPMSTRRLRSIPAAEGSTVYSTRLVWPASADTVPLRLDHRRIGNDFLVLPLAMKFGHQVTIDMPRADSLQAHRKPPLDLARVQIVRWNLIASNRVSAERALSILPSLP